MTAYGWARHELEAALLRAQEQGYDRQLALRALLAEVVEMSRQSRGIEDLAQELMFLADNLDPERDYAFMRP